MVRVAWDGDDDGGAPACSSSRSTAPSAATPSTTPRCSACSTPSATAADARVLVLTGAPPAFSAGADLTGRRGGRVRPRCSASVLRGFTELPIPTIAAIDGPALGAGTQLAVACDLRVATPASRFGIPAARLGLVVDHWTVERLARELGWPIARAMLARRRDVRRPPRSTPPAPCTASATSTTRWLGPRSSPRWPR